MIRIAAIACGICLSGLASCQAPAKRHPAELVVVERKDLGFEMPATIAARERKDGKEIDARLEYTQVHRAEDGTVFCCDDIEMSLWIRRQDHWECVLQEVRVRKTFGGAPPRLPVRYLGNGHFVYSETVPNSEKPAPEGELFPTALAITYLLDAQKEGANKVVARGEAFRYDHNPKLKIPEEWYKRSGTTPGGWKSGAVLE